MVANSPVGGAGSCGFLPSSSGTNRVAMASNTTEQSVSPSQLEDAELVQAALAGDKHAFGTLVVRYQDRLFNTLVKVLGSAEDARDVTQDAFVQAFVKLESFRGESQFYTWLYRIAMNLALSRRRRRKPVVSLDQTKQDAGAEPTDTGASPDDRLIEAERVEMLQAALAQLGDQQRQILVLREIEDCSYEAIAEILELPIGTVRSRLFRARLQLKEKLQTLLAQEIEQET